MNTAGIARQKSVANPAPRTPMFSTNRNTALRPVLTTQLMTALAIVETLFRWARRI